MFSSSKVMCNILEILIEKSNSSVSLLLLFAWTVALQAPLSMGFPRQEYWSRLPFPPGDLPDSGMEWVSLASLEMIGTFIPLAPPGKSYYCSLLLSGTKNIANESSDRKNQLEECLIKTKKAPASNAAQNNDALLCVFSASVVREFNPECPCFPPYFLLERNHWWVPKSFFLTQSSLVCLLFVKR